MKYLRILLAIVAGLFFSFDLFAQTMNTNMVFEDDKHDFGHVKEEGGLVSHKFLYTNIGTVPLLITNVNSSCGCTTPSWSKEPVPPGGKGFIKAVFDPNKRAGQFHKTIIVRSNSKLGPKTIHISGYVLPKPTLENVYKYVMGPIRLTKKNLHFSHILNTETKSLELPIINMSDEDVTISFSHKYKMPEHLIIKCIPETLKPNEKGNIKVIFNAKLKNEWAYVHDPIYIHFNGDEDFTNRINISAVIKEKFSEEMIKNPPTFTSLNGKDFNFGTIKQGEKVSHDFEFKNTGKHNLEIRKMKGSCGCTAVASDLNTIRPGQESSIYATFNSEGKTGDQFYSIVITTNIPDIIGEPTRSEIILTIKGKVETP